MIGSHIPCISIASAPKYLYNNYSYIPEKGLLIILYNLARASGKSSVLNNFLILFGSSSILDLYSSSLRESIGETLPRNFFIETT